MTLMGLKIATGILNAATAHEYEFFHDQSVIWNGWRALYLEESHRILLVEQLQLVIKIRVFSF